MWATAELFTGCNFPWRHFKSRLGCGRPGKKCFVPGYMFGRAGGMAERRGTSAALPAPQPPHPHPLSAPPPSPPTLLRFPWESPWQRTLALGLSLSELRAGAQPAGMAEAETEYSEDRSKTQGCRKILETLQGAIEQFQYNPR